MGNAQAIASLEAKRTELADGVRAAERRIAELRADIAALDRAMALLDPNHVPAEAPLRRRRARANALLPRGELRKSVLDMIRESAGAVTAHCLSERLLAAKGIDGTDKRACRAIENGVSATLSGLKAKGILANGNLDPNGRLTYSLIR